MLLRDTLKQRITIEGYNIQWKVNLISYTFINDVMEDRILSIEHVGRTSIKGLVAKPILDIDIVIEDYEIFPEVVTKFEAIGYYHQLEWSFKGREAFGRKDTFVPWNEKYSLDGTSFICDKIVKN